MSLTGQVLDPLPRPTDTSSSSHSSVLPLSRAALIKRIRPAFASSSADERTAATASSNGSNSTSSPSSQALVAQAHSLISVAAYRASMGAEKAMLTPPSNFLEANVASSQPSSASISCTFFFQAGISCSASSAEQLTSRIEPGPSNIRLGPVNLRASRNSMARVSHLPRERFARRARH